MEDENLLYVGSGYEKPIYQSEVARYNTDYAERPKVYDLILETLTDEIVEKETVGAIDLSEKTLTVKEQIAVNQRYVELLQSLKQEIIEIKTLPRGKKML